MNFLVEEGKIKFENSRYKLSKTVSKKFDTAYIEYQNRQKRIYETYFSKAASSYNAIENWFENVTIKFFVQFRSEWIAEKAYKTQAQSPYEGLKKLVKQETIKDQGIDRKDRDWLIEQYIAFFNSTDPDLDSIFWDYGTAAYTSSLIKSSKTANDITVDLIRDSKFILDTNILMYLTLEAGEYYDSYVALAEVFKKLNIKPGYFQISREEYVSSVAKKREQILEIVDNYEDKVIDDIKGDFVKTARARRCETVEDFETFFDTLIDPPESFINGLKLEVFDDAQLQSVFEKAEKDEELINILDAIFKQHQRKIQKKDTSRENLEKDKKIKGKKESSLKHDAALLRGAEHLRAKNEKCFILSRDITVKQYGVDAAKRDETSISIGLDVLISLLAIHDGGIDSNPEDFKPLFAKMIKLSLLPEKNVIRPEDLARLLDIEHDIARLPYDEVVSISKEAHNLKLKGESDEKIVTAITRRFQKAKMTLRSDLETKNREFEIERKQKNQIEKDLNKTEEALMNKILDDIVVEDKKWLRNQYRNLILILAGIWLLTFAIYYITGNSDFSKFEGPLSGLFVELLGFLIISFFVIIPRIKKRYKNRVDRQSEELLKRLNILKS